MKSIFAIASFFLFFLNATRIYAQDPAEKLAGLNKSLPIEKVYLHLDRENYTAGEIIWFNCYLYSDYLPDTISTTVFVEFINQSSLTLVKKVSPVVNGSSSGQIELPDSLTTGWYTIRAYTVTMLNQPDYLFNRRIFVYGKKAPSLPVADMFLRLEFFPEGGNFVSGLNNTIAFKLTDANGLPLQGKRRY